MYGKLSRRLHVRWALAVVLLGALASVVLAVPGRVSAPPSPRPAPDREVATFAAGCFWSMEAIFKQLKGVETVEPGYAGGTVANPSYEQVESGTTGHAESVNITFDPKVISYRDLLRVLLTVRDPTTLNRQGPDVGTQYRSVIFYRTEAQRRAAQAMIQRITAERVWRWPIVTAVTPFTNFYPAEAYHRDYYRLHPDEPYCRYVIAPEIEAFRAKFKSKLKPQTQTQ